jgi:hypothetical protein
MEILPISFLTRKNENKVKNKILSDNKSFSKFNFLFVLFISIALFSSSLISAGDTIIQEGSGGLQVEYPKLNIFKINEPVEMNFHAVNLSSGQRLYNDTTSCYTQIFGYNGTFVYPRQQVEYSSYTQAWRVIFSGGNFTRLGSFYVATYCNTSTRGGFVSFPITITSSGIEEGSVLNNSVFLVLLLLSIVLLFSGGVSKISALGFIGSVILLLNGVYTMIYGFNNITDLYTQAVGLVLIGVGFIFMFISGYEWYAESTEMNSEE